jgi:hypothetical protein
LGHIVALYNPCRMRQGYCSSLRGGVMSRTIVTEQDVRGVQLSRTYDSRFFAYIRALSTLFLHLISFSRTAVPAPAPIMTVPSELDVRRLEAAVEQKWPQEVDIAQQEGDEGRVAFLYIVREELARLRSQLERAEQEGNESRTKLLYNLYTRRLREFLGSFRDPYPVSSSEALPDPPPMGVDDYTNRLLKYIPAESVALYLTLQGIVLSGMGNRSPYTWLWLIFGIGLIGTPIYLWRVTKVSKSMQLVVSTLAFGVWVFALGGAFQSLSWYEPFIGSLTLVAFTFFAPLITPDSLGSVSP